MKLSQIREEIDKVDAELARLFQLRMQYVRQIHDCKEGFFPDAVRENEMIAQNSAIINDAALVKYYQEFFNCCLALSKQYQQDMDLLESSSKFDK